MTRGQPDECQEMRAGGSNRRSFLYRAGLGLAGLALMGRSGGGAGAAQAEGASASPARGSGTGGAGGARRLERIGVQLYTVRELMASDFERTLAGIAEIGYDEVEFAGYHGRSPGQIRSRVDGLDLDPVSSHIPLSGMRSDPASLIESAGEIGHRLLVLAWIDPGLRGSLDDWRRLAGEMTEFAGLCGEAGIDFAYHNHAFEFESLEGGRPYDVLLEASDPELVKLQIDLFWARLGGVDALELFQREPGRFTSCHVKDMGPGGDMVDVGRGIIDFPAVFAEAQKAGLRHFFVEHDESADPMESVARGYEHLAALTF